MRQGKSMKRSVSVLVALVAAAGVAGASIATRAAQAPPAQAAAPRPLVPMTAATIARNVEAHVGENVSMMAAVEAVLSKTVFTVDQDKAKSTGQEVLVIAPTLNAVPERNAYVTVQGEVFRFDPAEVARRARSYRIDLDPELVAKYQGRPAVIATAVITETLEDLARRVIPPMTPEEQAFAALMRAINPAFTALRGGLDQPDAAQAKAQLATIRKAFVDVEAFFRKRGTADAIQWSRESVALVSAMDASVGAGRWDEVRTSAGNLQQLCAACHTQHRERMEDGTFRFKSGGGG